MVSYLGRINYDFENKYYASASYRRDGSSRLARDSRWGNFWSVSGSWRRDACQRGTENDGIFRAKRRRAKPPDLLTDRAIM